MKRISMLVVLMHMAFVAVGCTNKEGTTESKSEITTSRSEDGQVTGESSRTYEKTTKTTPATPDGSGTTVQKTTETTTQTSP